MTTNLDTQYITEYLEECNSQAQQLMQLLLNERNVISSNDAPALEVIATSKEKLAQAIHASTQVCCQHLQQAGYGADAPGLTGYFQNCSESHVKLFKLTWEKLQLLLEQCQDENRINGKLLNNSQRRIKQALAILQGKPFDEELYGRGGETVNHSTGNSLTHA